MAVEIIMPKLGVDMAEGEIIEWKKAEGDTVAEGDVLLEIMSDKTNMEIEAEDSGVLLKITRQAGETVPVTETIGYIGEAGEEITEAAGAAPAPTEEASPAPAAAPTQSAAPTPAVVAAPQGKGGKVRATPAARKVAREQGVDLGLVPGSG